MKIAATAAVLVAAAVALSSAAPAPAEPLAPAAPSPAAAPAERQRPAATGGAALLDSAIRAQAVVAGVVSNPVSVDVHGWRAGLRIDRVLLGSLRLGDIVTIAWEELATARQVRFADGQRVLVVLGPLPTQSLWRRRFPGRDQAAPVLVVAADGNAFLARPDGVTLDVLGHYLALAPEARAGAPGARRLAELVRRAPPAVAREALALLARDPAPVALLDADGAVPLLAAARSAEREPSLRSAALLLAARHRLPGVREAALALGAPGSPIRADAYRALAALPGGLTEEQIERLLGDADADVRVVGVELAPAAVARPRFVTLAKDDPSPAVRLAAGRALLARDGSRAIPDVIGLLDDAAAPVRSGIAESIGAEGDAAVAPLRAVVDGGSERAALAAVYGLARAGRKGAAAVATIADAHPNEAVRTFARLAIGQALGHTH